MNKKNVGREEMKSAKEIRSIQEDAMRKNMENKLVHMAENCYVSYTCRSTECPPWLQEELINKGFNVKASDGKEEFGIKITW